MDKQQIIQEVQLLELALEIARSQPDFNKLDAAKASIISQAYSLYQEYSSQIPSAITDSRDFCNFISYNPIHYREIIANLKKDNNIRDEVLKENSSVPSELETMVALYKEHQAEQLTTERKNLPVSDLIKKARKTWMEHEKTRLIRENAKKNNEETDQVFKKVVNPKVSTRQEAEKYTRAIVAMMVNSQIGNLNKKGEIIEKVVLLAETGALDIENLNELYFATKLAIKEYHPNTKNSFDQIDDLVTQKLKYQETGPDSEKADQLDREIILAEQHSEFEFRQETKPLRSQLKEINFEGSNLNYDDLIKNAKTEIDSIINKLQESYPNPRLPLSRVDPLTKPLEELEKIINKNNPGLLNVQTTGGAARISATLQVTGGNISPKVIDLAGKGLTREKFEKLSSDPTSELSQFLKKHQTVYKRVQHILGKLENSDLNKDVLKGFKQSSLPPSLQKILNPKATLENYVNKKIGEHAGQLILKNTSNAAAKKFGNFILEKGLTEGSKAFVDAAAKRLLIEGAKAAGAQGAKLAGMAAAESAIAAAAAALGVSTAGLSLIIGAVLIIGTEIVRVVYDKFKEFYKNLTNEDFSLKEIAKGVAIGTTIAGTGLLAIGGGIKSFGIATKTAAFSAASIIILSLSTIAAFLTLTFLTAPLLSIFVQLDSVEKVKYDSLTEPSKPTLCANMPWPVKESCKITQGPAGKASHASADYSQAIDIACTTGTPVFSTTEGKVSFVGRSAPYLNTDIVIVDSVLAGGKTFQVVYAHLSSTGVSKDQQVSVGQRIGLSGTAGSGPHLHYEYKGIEYNECPAGDLQLAVGCNDHQIPGANQKCINETGPYLYSN